MRQPAPRKHILPRCLQGMRRKTVLFRFISDSLRQDGITDSMQGCNKVCSFRASPCDGLSVCARHDESIPGWRAQAGRSWRSLYSVRFFLMFLLSVRKLQAMLYRLRQQNCFREKTPSSQQNLRMTPRQTTTAITQITNLKPVV